MLPGRVRKARNRQEMKIMTEEPKYSVGDRAMGFIAAGGVDRFVCGIISEIKEPLRANEIQGDFMSLIGAKRKYIIEGGFAGTLDDNNIRKWNPDAFANALNCLEDYRELQRKSMLKYQEIFKWINSDMNSRGTLSG